ncbi:hypothetical protein MMC13_000818 [Lambiella insularis]|nr:hypothetical protein [Lambiella insularis]
METIEAFTVAPWHHSITEMVNITTDRETAATKCADAEETELQMFTDGSWGNGTVGYSVVVWTDGMVKNHVQRTIGLKHRVNVYIAELAAIMEAVDWSSVLLELNAGRWSATVYSDSMAAVRAIANLRHQSGQ